MVDTKRFKRPQTLLRSYSNSAFAINLPYLTRRYLTTAEEFCEGSDNPGQSCPHFIFLTVLVFVKIKQKVYALCVCSATMSVF
jgi:hypothetical protein